DAGPEQHLPKRAIDLGGNRPGAVAFGRRHILEGRAAKAAARRQERYGFQNVGLARPIRAKKERGAAFEIEGRLPVRAEVREFELQYAGVSDHVVSCGTPAHTRIGNST